MCCGIEHERRVQVKECPNKKSFHGVNSITDLDCIRKRLAIRLEKMANLAICEGFWLKKSQKKGAIFPPGFGGLRRG